MYESFSEFGLPDNFSGKKTNHKERPVSSKVYKNWFKENFYEKHYEQINFEEFYQVNFSLYFSFLSD